jgi:hypothetical protein
MAAVEYSRKVKETQSPAMSGERKYLDPTMTMSGRQNSDNGSQIKQGIKKKRGKFEVRKSSLIPYSIPGVSTALNFRASSGKLWHERGSLLGEGCIALLTGGLTAVEWKYCCGKLIVLMVLRVAYTPLR